MKKALREVIEKYNLSIRLTPNQNIILCDIRTAWKRPITTILAKAGLLVRCFSFTPSSSDINMNLWLLDAHFLFCEISFTAK